MQRQKHKRQVSGPSTGRGLWLGAVLGTGLWSKATQNLEYYAEDSEGKGTSAKPRSGQNISQKVALGTCGEWIGGESGDAARRECRWGRPEVGDDSGEVLVWVP